MLHNRVIDYFISYLHHFRTLQRNARLFLLSNIIINVASGAIGVLYTIFLTQLGYQTDFLSLLLVLGIVGAGVGLGPAIVIANRYSARRLLLWSNFIGGAAIAVQLFSPRPVVMILTTLFIGASVSIYIVLTPPLLAATSTDADRTHLFSINATLGLLTGVVGTLIGGFLPLWMRSSFILQSPLVRLARPLLLTGPALPLQLALLLAGIISLPSLWPLFLMDDAIAHLGERTVAPSTPSPPTRPLRERIADLRAWGAKWIRPATVRQALAWRASRYAAYQALLGFGAGLFLTYLNLYFVNHLHLGTEVFGTVASVLTIALAITTLTAPMLAERLGTVRGPIILQLLSVPLLAGIGILTNIPVIIVFYLLRGVLMNMGAPALGSFIMGMLPSRERGVASTVFSIGFQVMAGAGGVVSGITIAHWGYGPTYLIAAACYGGAMLLLLPWFGQEQKLLQPVS